MKKYKGWEIAKLISEGKLEGRKIELVNIGVGRNTPYMVNRAAMWDIECEREVGNSLLTNVYDEYIIPQEPVSFMDCVNSDKLVRVEHELIPKGGFSSLYRFDVLMFYMTNLGATKLKKVILEGKWYLEEAEDGEVQDL